MTLVSFLSDTWLLVSTHFIDWAHPGPISFEYDVFSVAILTPLRASRGIIDFTVEITTYQIIEKVPLMRSFSP